VSRAQERSRRLQANRREGCSGGIAAARESRWLTRAEPESANAGSEHGVAGARVGAVRAGGMKQERGGAGGAAGAKQQRDAVR
jgi:hypothetical protein